MKVKELKEALDKMPQDAEVIMFDGPASYTPGSVYVCQWTHIEAMKGKVIID